MNGFGIAAGGVLALGAGLLIRSQYERDCLSTEYETIPSPKIRSEKRLAFLTDLHNKEFGPGNRRLIEAIDRARPDLILVGGDMMVSKGAPGVEIPMELLKNLSERYPIYYGNGNHENRMDWEREVYGDQLDSYRKELTKLGVHYLEDKTELVGEDLAISGVDLEHRYYRKLLLERGCPLEEGYLEKRLGEAAQDRYQILLLHSPMFFSEAVQWGADLTLSGHFHGGTIRLPILGGVMTPQYQFFLPWCAGSFERDGKRMVVSRGLGTHSINIRLNNKPQLVILDLAPEGEGRPNVCADFR